MLAKLGSDQHTGLSGAEAGKRLEQHGPNKLIGKKPKTLIQRIFAQINDVLVYVLIGAAVISGAMGEVADAIIIALVVVLNATVGVVQESRAEHALEALKQLSTPRAVVKRDGNTVEIPSEEVVPGDLVILDAGRYIPCDLRLVETANLQVEESALTGESVPVDKNADYLPDTVANGELPLGDQKNMAFMSTLVTYGRGAGIAIATGMDSQIGKIASLLDEADEGATPLQKNLSQVGKYLGIGAIGICALMFVVGLLQGRELLDMFMTSISLAVAAIPEGMIAIVSIVLAIGVQRMIKQNVIIRKLPAVEALGSVNIICSDKTGTLTQNKMTVTDFYADGTFSKLESLQLDNSAHRLLLENLMLCNDASYRPDSKTGDPTEIALLAAGAEFNLNKETLEQAHKRVNELPFDSDRKLMSTLNEYDGAYYVMTKGAIDNLLPLVTHIHKNGGIETITEADRKAIMDFTRQMSDNALRVLGAAVKKVPDRHIAVDEMEQQLAFVGLVGMIDPPRTEVAQSIAVCKQAGIRTVMITGDHRDTAFAIAKELGIASSKEEVMEGVELNGISDAELSSRIDRLRVFARVSPEHKVKIVSVLRAKGNIVSMTGDGVNDAPSLKQADVGVAMGITGTDVAKGAADMVLTDDNFSSIVRAVEEGRNIYRNIKKAILFLLSCNLGEIVALFLSILFGWATPLRPIHILWVNLVTDSWPALSLGMDSKDPKVMSEKPRSSKESLFHGKILYVVAYGAVIGIATLAAFIIGMKMYAEHTGFFPLMPAEYTEDALRHAQTMAFAVLSFSQLVHSFNLRSDTKSVFQGFFTNRNLVYSLLFGVVLQVCIISIAPLARIFSVHALGFQDWLIVSLLSLAPLVVSEIVKIFRRMGQSA
ncbi:MAG: cation-translocating P-type ATPase [Paenibacillaceae bacterium]|nr:cation-translocating P-type ATPase [Paenibacillaceae bacterium]